MKQLHLTKLDGITVSLYDLTIEEVQKEKELAKIDGMHTKQYAKIKEFIRSVLTLYYDYNIELSKYQLLKYEEMARVCK